MPDTGYQSPNSFENMAGFVNDPANAYASDNTYAVFDPNSNESVDYFGFDFSSIPAGSQIDGIEISVEAYLFAVGDAPRQFTLTPRYNSRGTNAPSPANTGNFGGTDTTLTVGGATSLFGRTWTVGDFTTANFSIRIQEDCAFAFNQDLSLDHIQAKVYYTLPGWSGTINGVNDP
jgi:hypothetical protein